MAPVGPVRSAEVRLVLAPRLAAARSRAAGRALRQRVRRADRRGARARVRRRVRPGLAESIFPREPRGSDPARRRARARSARGSIDEDDRVAAERLRAAARGRRGARAAAGSRTRASTSTQGAAARAVVLRARGRARAARGALPGFDASSARRARATGARGWAGRRRDDPGDAIDEAEYDLALLGARSSQPSRRAGRSGAARYLLAANPHLARALRSRGARWKRRGRRATASCGRAAAERAGAARGQRLDRARVLADRAPALRRLPVPLPARRDPPLRAARGARGDRGARSADARLARPRGAVRRPARRCEPAACCRSRRARRAEARAHRSTAALDEVARALPRRLAPAIERVWDDGVDRDARRPARCGSRAARTRAPSGCRGASSSPSACRPTPSATRRSVRRAGAARRAASSCAARSTSSSARGDGALRVTDHKTGARPDDARIVDRRRRHAAAGALRARGREAASGKPRVAGAGSTTAPARRLRGASTCRSTTQRRGAARGRRDRSAARSTHGFLPAAPRDGRLRAGATTARSAVRYEEQRAGAEEPARSCGALEDLRRRCEASRERRWPTPTSASASATTSTRRSSVEAAAGTGKTTELVGRIVACSRRGRGDARAASSRSPSPRRPPAR